MPSSAPTLLSKCTVFPDQKSTIGSLKLSVSDLPMLSCHYIQKGCLFTKPPIPFRTLIPLLKSALSRTLSLFPPLAGRLTTDSDGYVYLTCNDALASISSTPLPPVSTSATSYPPPMSMNPSWNSSPSIEKSVTATISRRFWPFRSLNSFWNFFNTFAQVCKGAKFFRNVPDFRRESVLISDVVLRLPEGGPAGTFNADAPLRERIFSFSRESIQRLQAKTNNWRLMEVNNAVELMGKQNNDHHHNQKEKNKVTAMLMNLFKSMVNSKPQTVTGNETTEISSFQSICALLWRAVTRARKLQSSKTTTFRMAVNCLHQIEPKLEPYYFGNATQSVPTYAYAGYVLSMDLRWCAEDSMTSSSCEG